MIQPDTIPVCTTCVFPFVFFKTAYPVNTCEVPVPQPVKVDTQPVPMTSSPPISTSEAVKSVEDVESLHVPSIATHSDTPNASDHNDLPTHEPHKSDEDSTEKAAELLLFFSGNRGHKVILPFV